MKIFKHIFLNVILSFTLFIVILSCNKQKAEAVEVNIDSTKVNIEAGSENTQKIDSVALMNAFLSLKTNPDFLKDVGLIGEKQFKWNDDLVKIIYGDLNDDQVNDALLFFSLEGVGGGNNWAAHYAAFLNINNDWKYQNQIDAGGDFSDRILEFTKIKNGIIFGNWVGNKDESLQEIPVNYIIKNGGFINTFTGLHKEENQENSSKESVEDWEYLHAAEVLTTDHIVVPLSSTRKEYEKLLGKNYSIKIDKTAECGTVYEDTPYLTEMVFKNFTFELSAKNKATLTLINMKGTGLKFQTTNGTIDENTTIAELQKIFPKSFIPSNEFDENNEQSFMIGAIYEDLWILVFDRAGKLKRIQYHVQC